MLQRPFRQVLHRGPFHLIICPVWLIIAPFLARGLYGRPLHVALVPFVLVGEHGDVVAFFL